MVKTAFVSSFSGTTLQTSSAFGQSVCCTRTSKLHVSTVQAKYYLDKYEEMSKKQHAASERSPGYYLDKYEEMSGAFDPVPAPGTSGPSAYWVAFQNVLKERQFDYHGKGAPLTDAQKFSATTAMSMPYMRSVILQKSKAFGNGGDPDAMLNTPPARVADNYMAECIKKQYKMTAAPFGTYNVQCTEGVVRGQAEEGRNLALSATFRMVQRTSAQKFGDFCETRRKAIIAAHGCSYEESLLDRFPVAARAYVTAGSEARGNCVRYATGTSPAESYMADCVDKQMKFRAVPYGVYDVLCCDGNAKGVAEYKRVQALSARFRAQQLPAICKEQAKFNNAAYARDFFAHDCSYEENLFNKYAAVSASMRPSTARY